MVGIDNRSSCKKYFINLKILTVFALYILKLLELVHVKRNEFSCNNDFHMYNTRNKNNFNIPAHHSSNFNKSPFVHGLRMYNALPDCYKHITDPNKFKRKIKGPLFEICPYGFNEINQGLLSTF